MMEAPTYDLLAGESALRDCTDCHFLRPEASLVGRLCHPVLTTRRILLCESYYDMFGKREGGVGSVVHEVPLAAIEALREGPADAEPSLEFELRTPRNDAETLVLSFRDDGWALGSPARLSERDEWLTAIRAARGDNGAPIPAFKPRRLLQPAGRPAPGPAKDPHRVLAGKYELLRQIGAGGMGLVFEGRDHTLDRPVAIKKMRPDVKLAGRDMSLFKKEAKLSASLHHPFIVDIYAILEEDDEVYLVFEFVDGRTLQEIINDEGFLPPEKAVRALKHICEALAFAHASKVIHRDLKPSNIMLTRQGYAKVMDFGIARQIKDTASRLSTTKAGMDASGTMPYMAPEQELGRADARSDIFSLGVTVYEMLSGELPFIGPNFYLQKEKMAFRPISELVPEAPAELTQAVTRALSFAPDERFQTVAEFARAVGAA